MTLLFTLTALASGPEALVAEALDANPGLAAKEAAIRELEHLAAAAGSWMDPVVATELSNVSTTAWSLDGHPMSGLQLKLSQPLPAPGVTGARAEAAEARVAVAGHALDAARVMLAAQVEQTWWSLARVRALREVTERHLALTDEFVEVVRARYEVGGAGQHALLRLGVQRDRLEDQLGDFDADDAALVAALAAALHRDALVVPPADELVLRPAELELDAWLSTAIAESPELEGWRASEAAAEAAARAARLEARPDPTVWVGYRVRTVESATDPGVDLVSAGVSLPIPVGSKRRGDAAEAAALEVAGAARSQAAASRDRIQAELSAELARWERAEDKAHTYADTLLPAAQLALDTTLSDYRVGRADFASLYQAWTTLLDLERGRLNALVDTHLTASRVHALAGQLPSSP